MKKIVIGSVPYLNAKPLTRWFTDTEEGRGADVEVIEAVPSELANLLERGEVACALVSSFELFRTPGLIYAPGSAVSADGAVRSVRLLSRVPIGEIKSVALDTSSLTSVALVKILLAELYGLTPEYLPHPPNLDAMLAEADAALLIGDLGYREYDSSLHVLDLGAGWKELTGLPFVYALWIGPEATLTPDLADILTQAKDWGQTHPKEIALSEYERLGETYERTYSYLTEIMRYTTDDRADNALRLFGEKAYTLGLIGEKPVVKAVTR